MRRKERDLIQIDRDISTAGKSFLGLYMEYVLTLIEEGFNQHDIIDKLHSIQVGFRDKDREGTRVRVNALFRIVQAEKVLYSLQAVLDSPKKLSKGAKDKARETIDKINSGEIELPNLR